MLYNIFKIVFKKAVVHRYEDISYIVKRTKDDYPLLNSIDFSFKSNDNTLRGKQLFYDNYKSDKVIIFCHGLRRGFNDYYPILNDLCKQGYYVIVYNNTGCHTSEGKNIVSMTQSLGDLTSFFKYAEKTKLLEGKEVIVMGHSWGGYAAGNILNYYKNISKVVVFSGFVSATQIGKSICTGKNKNMYKPYLKFEKRNNPLYFNSSSYDAYKNNPDKKILLIHSHDDTVVPYNESLGYLESLGLPSNVSTIIYDNKTHHPFWTLEGLKYREEMVLPTLNKIKNDKKLTEKEKHKSMEFVDYNKYYDLDHELFNKIYDFIEK